MLNLTLKNIPKEPHVRLEAEFAAPIVDAEAQTRTLRAFVARLPRVDHARVTRYKRQGRAKVCSESWNGPASRRMTRNLSRLPRRRTCHL